MNTYRPPSENNARDSVWPVMVLAHNEAKKITACLDSIYKADPAQRFSIFVIANGCTDNTEDIVKEYAGKHDGVNLISIEMGDKNNAWNVFIHETVPAHAPDRDVYFFMDGDCRACPGAFSELAKGLAENEEANAAGAVPMAGRNKKRDSRELVKDRCIVANLYALSGRFVRRLQAKGVRLPIGLEGDDGLLGILVKWDLDPCAKWDHNSIVPCIKAGFTFNPVSPMDFRTWKKYWRRLIRYGRRYYEFQLLGPRLKKDGVNGLPECISELYPDSKKLKLYWQGIYTITNYIALKQLQKHAK